MLCSVLGCRYQTQVILWNLYFLHFSKRTTGISGSLRILRDDGCALPKSDGLYRDDIVMIERGGCSFERKVLNAEKAGAR